MDLRASHGSSLVETVMVMPILILTLCFAIDIGYFFIVAANLVSSARNAVLYSGQGFVSPGQQELFHRRGQRGRWPILLAWLDWRVATCPP